MGSLAERYGEILREHGFDPAARQGDVHALARLEESDAKAAQERFQALKRQAILERRALALAELRQHAFVLDLPPRETTGYREREIESELVALERALRHARAIAASLDAERTARASVRERALPPESAIPRAAWDHLAPLAEGAEAARRVAAREARIEERARAAARRVAKLARLRVAAPPVAQATDEALDAAERALADAEAVEDAHRAALAPLRDPVVGERRRESRRRIERRIEDALEGRDAAALAALGREAEALREEAAREAEAARRARRRGEAQPARERRAGDPLDPYG